MSKSVGQVVGGVIGATLGFISGGPMGAVRGYVIGSSIGGMIDPPPGPNLKGPTLEDTSFNSAAYGIPIATLYGTIAQTGQIIYLENNSYKSIAKKQKTGGKGGSPAGSYTTTTYYATFAVAIAEAMPGSIIRRMWAGGKLIYSVGDGVDAGTLIQSKKNAKVTPTFSIVEGVPVEGAEKWHYYDGTQTESDSRMESVLGVDNCPSYEGTAYIVFYDFDLTEYGNGLQGCPIKVEMIASFSEENDELPFQKIFESVIPYPASIYNSGYYRENVVYVRALTPTEALFIAQYTPYYGGNAYATFYRLKVDGPEWVAESSEIYNTDIHRYPGLTFGDYLNWQEFDPTSGTIPNNYEDNSPTGWTAAGNVKLVFGSVLHSGSFNWSDELSGGAVYGDGHYYIINNTHVLKITTAGDIVISVDTTDSAGGIYYRLWYDGGLLYRAQPTGDLQLKVWVYAGDTLDLIREFSFGNFPADAFSGSLQFAVFGGLVVVGWSTRDGVDGGEIHYEQWRIKNFNIVQRLRLDVVVGDLMDKAGVPVEFRNLTDLQSDFVTGYRITEVASARGSLGALQVAYLFDLIDFGYQLKAIKRGSAATRTIPLTDLNARPASDAPSVLVRRDRETDSQLPSRFSLTYIDYNREYDTGTQYADYPSRAVNERNEQLPIVLSADQAAQLADVLVNLAWVERDSYTFSVPQKYLALRPSDVISVEVAVGIFSTLRIGSINYTSDQRLEITAKRAAPAVYQSGAVGVAVAPPSELITLVGTASAILMDLPAVNDATTGYGFGAVMYGGNNWNGGTLLRSVDNNQTYDPLQAYSSSGTVATAQTVLAIDDCFVIDRESTLNISVKCGDFFSIAESQMLTGKNYCAYGVDGRWEILQYANSVINSASSMTLSIFLRGLFGTEWATGLHQANDFIVLLDDPDNAFIGADAVSINSPRKFKSVTIGQDAQDVIALDFIYRGINLKPLSPINVIGVLDVEEWTISYKNRTRMMSSQWSTGIAAPIGEAALLFDIEIYDGATLKNTYHSAIESFVYSAVNQVEDFGHLPTEFTVKIYQISAAIGRGYPVEKTLIGAGDLYRSFVVLQLNCNGSDGSPTFTDISAAPKAVTANGDAKISTTQYKNGGASALFYGAGDYLSVAHHTGLALGPEFCIEFDIFVTALGSVGGIIFDKDGVSGSSYPSFQLSVLANGKLQAYLGTGNGTSALQGYAGVTSLAIGVGVWSHIAFCCDGVTVRFFINGVLDFSSSTIPTRVDGGKPLLIGYSAGQPSGYFFNGGLDNIRITNGAARYIADFTPPTQQHPDP